MSEDKTTDAAADHNGADIGENAAKNTDENAGENAEILKELELFKKLFLMLGSDQEGERNVALSKLQKSMAKIGLDFPTLLEQLENGGNAAEAPPTDAELQELVQLLSAENDRLNFLLHPDKMLNTKPRPVPVPRLLKSDWNVWLSMVARKISDELDQQRNLLTQQQDEYARIRTDMQKLWDETAQVQLTMAPLRDQLQQLLFEKKQQEEELQQRYLENKRLTQDIEDLEIKLRSLTSLRSLRDLLEAIKQGAKEAKKNVPRDLAQQILENIADIQQHIDAAITRNMTEIEARYADDVAAKAETIEKLTAKLDALQDDRDDLAKNLNAANRTIRSLKSNDFSAHKYLWGGIAGFVLCFVGSILMSGGKHEPTPNAAPANNNRPAATAVAAPAPVPAPAAVTNLPNGQQVQVQRNGEVVITRPATTPATAEKTVAAAPTP